VIHCNSDTPEEMHHWISLLQKPKGDARIDGQEFLVRGESFFEIFVRFCMYFILFLSQSSLLSRNFGEKK